MSIKIVIPARYNSTRLPGKPLVLLNNIPMVVRVYKKVKLAFPLFEAIVAVDDEKVSKVLDAYDIPWVMTKTDHESGTDRVFEVCKIKSWSEDSIILNVQGDEPLISIEMLKEFANDLLKDTNIEVATISSNLTGLEELNDYNVVKLVCDKYSNAIYFSRFPIPFNRDLNNKNLSTSFFRKHVGVYAYRLSSLAKVNNSEKCFIENNEKLEQLRVLWLGIKIKVFHYYGFIHHGVDTEQDVVRVNRILEKTIDC